MISYKKFSADDEGCRSSAITQGLNSEALDLITEGAVFGLEDLSAESLAVLGVEKEDMDQAPWVRQPAREAR